MRAVPWAPACADELGAGGEGGGAGGAGGAGRVGGNALGSGTSSGDGSGASGAGVSLETALGWSEKQARILTGGGTATNLYTAGRGYPFSDDELPHHHLQAANTRTTFATWAKETAEEANPASRPPSWLTGAWARPHFEGGGEISTSETETCYNLVTPTAFVDVRIPTSRDKAIGEGRDWSVVAAAFARGDARPLRSLTDLEVSRTQAAPACLAPAWRRELPHRKSKPPRKKLVSMARIGLALACCLSCPPCLSFCCCVTGSPPPSSPSSPSSLPCRRFACSRASTPSGGMAGGRRRRSVG